LAWTGQQLFVIGFDQSASGDSVPGQMRVMAYEPDQRRWRLLPDPPIRGLIQTHPVWTGHELLLWGGNLVSAPPTAQGAAYDPTGNRWRQLPSGPLPTRTNATTVWTGQEMIIFGGEREPQSNARPDGAAYNPVTNQWRTVAPPPFGFGNSAGNAAAVSGQDLIIWSGYGDRPNDGAAYDPAIDRWRQLAPAPIPGRFDMSAVWTGHTLFVWGGDSDQNRPTLLADGATYDATANAWHTLPPSPLRAASDAVAVWTGHQVLIVDGFVQVTTPIRSGTDAATYTP
jgi:N-acetylneuraminic acid mutarotase